MTAGRTGPAEAQADRGQRFEWSTALGVVGALAGLAIIVLAIDYGFELHAPLDDMAASLDEVEMPSELVLTETIETQSIYGNQVERRYRVPDELALACADLPAILAQVGEPVVSPNSECIVTVAVDSVSGAPWLERLFEGERDYRVSLFYNTEELFVLLTLYE